MNAGYSMTGFGYFGNNPASAQESRRTARILFNWAHYEGRLRRLSAKLTGRSTALQTLTHMPVGQPSTRSNRVTYVPLERIVGSEGRSEDFDNHFNPLKTHNLERWLSVAVARRAGVPLPPVELVRVGDDYYVRDGHHRISVAKITGQLDIEAVIVN